MTLKHLTFFSNDCDFYCTPDETVLYKFCKTNSDIYYQAFQREFHFLKNLEQALPSASYFPRYYSYGRDKRRRPYIAMEYIHGIPLEQLLTERFSPDVSEPRTLFQPKDLSHICSQIYDALQLLQENDILYFDLNPKNILIVSDSFDIRLVDFTFCYHPSLGSANSRPRAIDSHMHPDFPPALKLQYSMMIFFTRLFFSGNERYQELFRQLPQTEPLDCRKAQNTAAFFRSHYGSVLEFYLYNMPDSFFFAEDETIQNNCLDYLTRWYGRLKLFLDDSEL